MAWLVDFVKEKEGFRNHAYQDSVGVWTIGYGSTKGIKKGDEITLEDAEVLLRKELQDFLDYVIAYRDNSKYTWNSNQVAALTSFIFNLGKGRLKQVTQNGTRTNGIISKKMRLYNKAGGQVLAGLVRRRNEESDHFNS